LLDHADKLAGGILAHTGARLKVKQEIFDVIQNNYVGFVESVCAFGLSPKSDAGKLRPQIENFTQAGSKATFGDFSACNQFDVMDRLAEIQIPILVLSATDDVLTPPKYGQFLADNLPNAQLANISDAGHMAPFEKPDAVNQAIKAYLQSLETALV
jgi:pimeloyl-ACP methyl ester carboxylesterase